MTQSTLYLSLTFQHNGQSYTWPLTLSLLAMYLMAALPIMAWQTASHVTYSALSFISATLLTLIMFQILFKSLAWGVRS